MSAVFTPTRTRITVARFHRMVEAGVLTKYDRVELIEGEMIDMAPMGSLHAHAVTELNMLLARMVPEGVRVTAQTPVELSELSEPQPDLMVLGPRPGGYRTALPRPADVLLLVEVSDTTLAFDRGTKLALYAKGGIAEVWIVDLQAGRLEICRDPRPEGYGVRHQHGPEEIVHLAALPEVAVAWGRIFA